MRLITRAQLPVRSVLGEFDIPEHRDRSPWVLGLIVQPSSCGRGIGRLLLSHLELFAPGHGYLRLWRATDSPAVSFDRRSGFAEAERVPYAWGDPATILAKPP